MEQIERMLEEIQRACRFTRQSTGIASIGEDVLDVFRKVHRHEFVPADAKYLAYLDTPVPIGCGQTVSEPFIVALMTSLLETKPDDRVLEIGTGSGYQAAILSHLVKEVYSVEIVTPLAERARRCLQRLAYDNVVVHNGDGYYGWPEHAPYGGIIVTAASPSVPPALIHQLKPNRNLVIPIGQPYGYQELMLVKKTETGEITRREVLSVAFVPLTGKHKHPSKRDEN